MALTKHLQQKAAHLAKLLHDSLLDYEVKEFILHHLADLPEDRVTGLISMLENEKIQLTNLQASTEASVARSDVRWQKLADKQRQIAERFASNILADLKK